MQLPELPAGWQWTKPTPQVLTGRGRHRITFGARTDIQHITRTVETDLTRDSAEEIEAVLEMALQQIVDEAQSISVVTSNVNVLIDFYKAFE